jgi:uncharacterized protein
MNKQPVRGVDFEDVGEDTIAHYLQMNPDFFERHPGLLTKLKLPHGRGASTVSLIERQVLMLRDKNQKLETRLHELIEVARGNDALSGKIHRLARRLIGAKSATALIDAMECSLREDFGASEWLILVPGTTDTELGRIASRHLRVVDAGTAELRMFDTLFESGRPRCGQIRDSQRDYLFGVGTVEIGSAALVPFGAQPASGLLAIGSPDTERFHPTMSTDFLGHIGELVNEAITAL